MVTPRVQAVSVGTCHRPPADPEPEEDREMRCLGCGTRAFSSRAPELVAAGERCPRCGADVTLVP